MQGVQLSKVNKLYGSVKVIDDLDLHFAPGEFAVLVGPSGCGKTTTLRMIAGLESISSGDLTIAGVRANDLSPAQRDIAMVFQNYALYPNMSVYDNMAFGLRNRGASKADVEREIKRAADVLGIQPLLSRKPRQLSGGQQQRVALGRCLVRHPKLFLFDEPLSNLDAKLRLEMRQELKRLRKRITATSVYVTHDQIEAMTLGDRVVVMAQGLVQQAGPPEEIYHRPANVFVATFIGSPSMNLIEGTLTTRSEQLFFSAEGIEVKIPPHLAAVIPKARSSRVLLGIRPEHISVSSVIGSNQDEIAGTIDLTELLGSEQLVQVQCGGSELTVTRVDPFLSFASGQPISLSFLQDHLHIFDLLSTRSLTAEAPSQRH